MTTLQTASGVTIDPSGGTGVIGTIALLNGEIVLDISGATVVTAHLTGIFVGTFAIAGTVDGTNYIDLPTMAEGINQWAAPAGIVAPGLHVAMCGGFDKVRIRCTAYTSGAALIGMRGSSSPISALNFQRLEPSTLAISTLGTANAITTATLPAPGVGLFHYITSVTVTRINGTAAAVVGTALLSITTTNLPGALAWSSGNAMAVGESKIDVVETWPNGLKSTTANTATTIVAPAGGAGIQHRIVVTYRIGR